MPSSTTARILLLSRSGGVGGRIAPATKWPAATRRSVVRLPGDGSSSAVVAGRTNAGSSPWQEELLSSPSTRRISSLPSSSLHGVNPKYSMHDPTLLAALRSSSAFSNSIVGAAFDRSSIRADGSSVSSARTFATTTATTTNTGTSSSSGDTKDHKGASKQENEESSSSSKSFADTIHRLSGQTKQEGTGESTTGGATDKSSGSGQQQQAASAGYDVFRKAIDVWDGFKSEVSLAWKELLESGQRKNINKKVTIHPHATYGAPEYTGPLDLVVIDPSENLTAWERMQKRLSDTPIIAGMIERSEQLYESTGAKQVKEKVDHLREDAKEAWETSQNPWVYRISSVYDTLTADSPESIAVKELRVLDPEFTLEDWRRDVVEHTLPQIMSWFLQGEIAQLQPWLGEGVFKRIAAEITARKQEGVEIDTHVLGIMNSEILAVEPDDVERGSPIILLHFMVQQINCTRRKVDGTVVEGSEDEIRANSYVAAFQREYNEERGELNWKIVDFRFNGAIAYL